MIRTLSRMPEHLIAKGWNCPDSPDTVRTVTTLERFIFELLREIAIERKTSLSVVTREYIEDGIAKDCKHS